MRKVGGSTPPLTTNVAGADGSPELDEFHSETSCCPAADVGSLYATATSRALSARGSHGQTFAGIELFDFMDLVRRGGQWRACCAFDWRRTAWMRSGWMALTGFLRQELLQLDVEDVTALPAGEPPLGAPRVGCGNGWWSVGRSRQRCPGPERGRFGGQSMAGAGRKNPSAACVSSLRGTCWNSPRRPQPIRTG